MDTVWRDFGLVVLCYLVGSIPTGVLLTRNKYGIDVREMGSGNIGATNVTRVFGWYAGALTFIVDFLKGVAPLWWLRTEINSPVVFALCGFSLVAGHCFSVFLKFRGGKGVATGAGVLLATSPVLAAVTVGVFAIVLAITKISAVGSLAGVLAALFLLIPLQLPVWASAMVLAICILVVWRHKPNIRRLYSEWKGSKQ